MASGPGADSLPDEEGLAELARRIKIGDQAAIRDFHSMFTTGIEFLPRRKLGKSRVSTEATRVLETAVQEIQKSAAVDLSRVVAHSMKHLFPALTTDIASNVAEPSREQVAHSVLAERTPLEQDILRRRYLLRESPAKIRSQLRVSSGTIEEAIASARADFRRRTQRTESA
jgi:DNA-directed RNA polymerase specialized sigma24 family protein